MSAPVAPHHVNWKVITTLADSRESYKNDPAVPPYTDDSQVVWWNLIREPVIQNFVGEGLVIDKGNATVIPADGVSAVSDNNSVSVSSTDRYELHNMMSCWLNINEYRQLMVDRVRRRKAAVIFETYVENDASHPIPVRDEVREFLRGELEVMVGKTVNDENGDANVMREPLKTSIFDDLQKTLFELLYERVYLKWKDNLKFIEKVDQVKTEYNQVQPNDFEYFSPKLGEGAFGAVVRCRKISTGRIYAMKIQRKVDLLGSYREDPRRVDLEVRVLATLKHRFLTGMDYSFQTEHFAMIAMGLAEKGTLERVQDMYANKIVPEYVIKFFVAEISDAVHHLHRIGLIYRDMKLQNVLLDRSGHIKLADLGGVVDTTKGKTIKSISGKSNISFPFAPRFSNSAPSENVENLTNPKRRRSIMGTRGYMVTA